MATDAATTGAPDRPTTVADRIDELRRRLTTAGDGAAPGRVAHRAPGRLSARQRIERLLDAGSFLELDALVRHRSTNFGIDARRPDGDGVVTGHGTVDGRPVCVFAHDSTVFGGSLGEAFGGKIAKVMDLAARIGCPIVGINDSGGGRIQEGVVAQATYGEIFHRNVRLSGVVPQISVIMGACAGGAAYSPALTDFVVMVDGASSMFVTGPNVIRSVTGGEVGIEELGGARVHAATSGSTCHVAHDEEDALRYVARLLSYLPSTNRGEAPVDVPVDPPAGLGDLDAVIPDTARQSYDIRVVLRHVLDGGELLEIQPRFARNIVVGFGRIDGHSVGVVANQPKHLAGCVDIDASEKAARFIRACDAFNVPIVTLVDTPGFLPGIKQELNGIVRRGSKLIYAYAEATVPKVTVVLRKAYGGAYVVMGSKHLGGDLNFAWPTAEIAVMGAEGAVDVLYRKELARSDDPGKERRRLASEYAATLVHPYAAAERGYVDAVIVPAETRGRLIQALRVLRGKAADVPARKHGNVPM